jgi:hypothetical protein
MQMPSSNTRISESYALQKSWHWALSLFSGLTATTIKNSMASKTAKNIIMSLSLKDSIGHLQSYNQLMKKLTFAQSKQFMSLASLLYELGVINIETFLASSISVSEITDLEKQDFFKLIEVLFEQ